jgi:hypothetical protein
MAAGRAAEVLELVSMLGVPVDDEELVETVEGDAEEKGRREE